MSAAGVGSRGLVHQGQGILFYQFISGLYTLLKQRRMKGEPGIGVHMGVR